MKDVGFKGSYSEFTDLQLLKPEEVFNGMETNSIDVSQQARNAENHFERLDEYLINLPVSGFSSKHYPFYKYGEKNEN
ncbi:hypothetical protein D3C80_1761830 [compost metagenome]